MPIGCAGAIKQGATFEDFVVRSAALFVSQLSLNSPALNLQATGESPLFDELAEARACLATLEAMDEATAQAECDAEYESQCKLREAAKCMRGELRQRYEATLARLRAWSPDVPAFESLRDSMAEQVAQSIDCDCRECTEPPLVHMTAHEWRIQKMVSQSLMISHLERRNAHFTVLQALRKSLGIEPSSPT